MARISKTKTTVSLDEVTRQELAVLAQRWRCSLAAVIRRAVGETFRQETAKAVP